MLFILRNSQKTIPYVFCFVILWSLASLRDISIGTDTKNYQAVYNSISFYFGIDGISVGKGKEIFYSLLFYIGNTFGWSYQTILGLLSLFFLVPVFFVFRSRLNKPIMGLLIFYALYYYCCFFNGSRQLIAVAVTMLGILYIEKGELIKFLAIVFVASLIHTSALIALIAWPLKYLKPNLLFCGIILVTTFVLGWMTDMSSVLSFLVSLSDRTSSYSGYIVALDSKFPLTSLMNTITFIYVLYYYKDDTFLENNIFLNMWFFEIVLINLFAFSANWGLRMTYYFGVARCFFFTQCFMKKKNIGSVIIAGYISLIWLKNIIPGAGEIVPYIFFWE